MSRLATTRLSSKGQIVIPENIRESLKLHTGDQFVVVAERDVIILKMLSEPKLAEFDNLIQQTRVQARQAKLKQTDIAKATKKVRKAK